MRSNRFEKRIVRFLSIVSLLVVCSCLAAVADAQTAPVPEVRNAPPPPPVFAPRAGVGAATGQGIGAANGTGIGMANGRGIGASSGRAMGGTGNIVLIDPSVRPASDRIFRSRTPTNLPNGPANGIGIGTATAEGIGTADGSGTGTATGNGVGTGSTTDAKAQAAVPEIRNYIRDADGKCFWVTNLGEKSFVEASKCELN